MVITKCTGITCTDSTPNRSIKYIVVHYTAGTKVTSGTAKSIAQKVRAGEFNGSADFYVDEYSVIQYNGDIKNRSCWAVGGKKYTTMSTSQGGKYYGVCTNTNSISVEMCSCKTSSKTMLATDTDWYITDKVVNNTVELVKTLMSTYNISIDRVLMHHHITGKICPNPWCVSENRLSEWTDFENRLTAKITTTVTEEDDEMVETIKVNINGKEYNTARILKNGKNYIAISDLEQAGFEIGYNADTKIPSITNTAKELKILVDNKETSVEAMNINGSNYVPIRSISAATGAFDVDYKNGTVVLKIK